jgi:hypothetical protein
MKSKAKGGKVAALLGRLLDAVRDAVPRPSPVLRPIPATIRRPAARPDSRW